MVAVWKFRNADCRHQPANLLLQHSRNASIDRGPHAARVPFSAARRKHRSTNFPRTVWCRRDGWTKCLAGRQTQQAGGLRSPFQFHRSSLDCFLIKLCRSISGSPAPAVPLPVPSPCFRSQAASPAPPPAPPTGPAFVPPSGTARNRGLRATPSAIP
jgi:hypothetical protein